MNNELVPQPSWWKRNWKWVVPTGGCLTLIIIGVVFIISTIYGISSTLSNSDESKYVMEQLLQNEDAIEILGQPLEKGNVSNYNFQWINGQSKISFKMKVTGSKNEGTVSVSAEKKGNDYSYEEIILKIDETNETIDILSN